MGKQDKMTEALYTNPTPAFEMFPNAFRAVSLLSEYGAKKHAYGVLRWRRDVANDHAGSLSRHQAARGCSDVESGMRHEVAVAWRALAQLEEVMIQEYGAAPGWRAIGEPGPKPTSGGK